MNEGGMEWDKVGGAELQGRWEYAQGYWRGVCMCVCVSAWGSILCQIYIFY